MAGCQSSENNSSSATTDSDKKLLGMQNRDALTESSNFKAIYGNPQLRAAFFLFLQNVFHLYPEDSFHKLIEDITLVGKTDQDIYRKVQSKLPTIKPFLSEATYALPALWKQKEELSRETLQLLGTSSKINGYLEVGSTGRYLSKLRTMTEISGDIVTVNVAAPTYSPVDIAERGQLNKLGRYVSLNNYEPVSDVADNSIDVVANYIGFHHSPPEKRDTFMQSLYRTIRPGGRLILRDHDVSSASMNRMVALAHDVFNLGVGADWPTNQSEIRNFTSIPEIVTALEKTGFKYKGTALLQAGDPTHNALMEFVKV
ncbi:dehydrogenase [Stenotrophobium rhamnosiphilum]|uniref:Dehydrogenase n=2 Tax=Stenotrophobium rhamnosiphilum TaxID=2029166 RepID=A0A2T5MK45_9GAMM|nr:dehydrogenase [Stenotrophobium rhamnosiphilum]